MLNVKLGKKKAVHDFRTLRMATYLDLTQLPEPPAELKPPTIQGSWGMMGNDRLGDCTFAAAGHLLKIWSADNVPPYTTNDDEYGKEYLTFNHGVDEGCIEIQVLRHWKKYGIAGRKISAFLATNSSNANNLKIGMSLFGGVYTGVELPVTAQRQDVWDIVADAGPDGEPGSWGGHAIPLVGYTTQGPICVTWGELKQITWAWWFKYGSPSVGGEAYPILSKDWCPPKGTDTGGFNYSQLKADLKALD